METKSIKIPTIVHKELKVFTAQYGDNMAEFAGLAIMTALKERGHRFVHPKKKKLSNGILYNGTPPQSLNQ